MPSLRKDAELRSILRCPCGRGLTYSPVADQPLPDGSFGVLDCGSHAYPVIDGIPVIRRGTVPVQDHCTGVEQVPGPSVDTLVAQVRSGRCLDALISLLAFAPALPLGLERVPIVRLPLTRGPGRRVHLALRRRNIRARLRSPLHEQTAEEWLRLFYRESRFVDPELFAYFLMRFSMPRFVAALSMLTLIPPSDRPVLDVGCGFGHVMHHIDLPGAGRRSVGLDRNFFQLWVARRWIAPAGGYVCADADEPLPFRDGAFSGVVSADSFHMFGNMAGCLAEMRRCAPDGLLALICIGNRLQEPAEGFELSPTEYADLAGDADHRLVGMSDLVADYRRGLGLQLAAPRDPKAADGEKWLCMVIAGRSGGFVDAGRFDAWPHGAGPLGINPIYRRSRVPGGLRLDFEFPSRWYAFENGPMTDYHASGATLDEKVLDQLRRGERTARVQELIKEWVVLGLPERYLLEPLRARGWWCGRSPRGSGRARSGSSGR